MAAVNKSMRKSKGKLSFEGLMDWATELDKAWWKGSATHDSGAGFTVPEDIDLCGLPFRTGNTKLTWLYRDIYRFSRDRPRFTDTLDMIKFLCKDIWTLVFRKQIDNLKTNHRV